MAIFIDSQNNWRDTEKESELQSMYQSLVGPNNRLSSQQTPSLSNDDIASLLVQKQLQQDRIDTQTELFTSIAASTSGKDVLAATLGDQSQDIEVRAAAAQALTPGMRASVGKHGELSFTAAPGSDLGYNYPDTFRKTSPTATNSVALDSLTKQISELQNTDDYATAVSISNSIQQSANEFLISRKQEYEQQVGGALGLPELQNRMDEDKILDQRYYDTYYGGRNLGPSIQSEQTLGQFQRLRAERDKQVEEKLSMDPEALAIKAQLDSMTTLISQRFKETVIPTTNLIPPETIDATVGAMYGTTNASPADRQRIARDLQDGNMNSPVVQAREVAEMDAYSQAMLATTSSGPTARFAENALTTKLQNPQLLTQIKSEIANFDEKYLSKMSKEEQAQYKVPATATSLKDREAAKQEINAKKFQHVMNEISNTRRANFEYSVTDWATPQDPILQAEFTGVIETLKAAKQRNGDKDPKLSIDEVIRGLDWRNPNPAKIQALTNYIVSQANDVSDSALFPAPASYANETLARSYVNSVIARARSAKYIEFGQFSRLYEPGFRQSIPDQEGN